MKAVAAIVEPAQRARLTRRQREVIRRRAYLLAPEGQKPVRSVYFLSAPNGLVKIGSALDVDLRVQEIRSMSPVPLELLGVVADAGERTERHLHRIYHLQRRHGEWFAMCRGEVVGLVEQLTRQPITEQEFWQ